MSDRISDGVEASGDGVPDGPRDVLSVPEGWFSDGRSPAECDAGADLRGWEEHWEEVELFLETWESVARAWGNETLMRLARYARLEADTEKACEREAMRYRAQTSRQMPPFRKRSFTRPSTKPDANAFNSGSE